MVSISWRRLASNPVALTGVLVVVMLVIWAFDLGPTALFGIVGFVVILLLLVARQLFRQALERGPAWTEDAQRSRHDATEAAAELTYLRKQRARGEISESEFNERAAEILDTESLSEARASVGAEPEQADDSVDTDPE